VTISLEQKLIHKAKRDKNERKYRKLLLLSSELSIECENDRRDYLRNDSTPLIGPPDKAA